MKMVKANNFKLNNKVASLLAVMALILNVNDVASLESSLLVECDATGRTEIILNEEPIHLDLFRIAYQAEGKDCQLKFTTSSDRIIAFTASDLDLIEAFVDIEVNVMGRSKLPKENKKLEKSRKDLMPTVYSEGNSATIRVSHDKFISMLKTKPTEIKRSPLKLRVSKAFNCPFNLGPESQCGRIVDEVSCYCATFTKRKWTDQFDFCKRNNFSLLTIESYDEEKDIYSAWGNTTVYWTSLNDRQTEGIWIWESTKQNLYPWANGIGYANWGSGSGGEPNGLCGSVADEDCMNIGYEPGWNDAPCSGLYDAICESH